MKKVLGILLLTTLCVHIQAINWGAVGFVITNETLYQQNRMADRLDQFYQVFNLTIKTGRLSAGLTLRAKNFYKQEQDWTLKQIEIDLYKAFIQYQGKSLRLQAGDFHAMFGRGLVLSILPNEKLLRERTILGGDIDLHLNRWHWRTLGGIVRDETRSREWALFGSEAEYQYGTLHKAGWHLSYIDDIGSKGMFGSRLNGSFSLAGNFLSGTLAYSMEAAFLAFSNPEYADGKALFAGLTFNKGPWTIMAEVKQYRNFFNELNNPPNADREDELGVMDDARATRLYLQYSFNNPDLLLFFNASALNEYGINGNHFYGGLTIQDLFDRLNLSAAVGVRRTNYPVLRLDADLVYMIRGPWSLEITYREKTYHIESYRFLERDLTTQVALARWGSLFLQYQYSAQPVLNRRHFYSGGARFYLSSASYIEAMIGTLRGGEICAQGQCFYVQPFQGFKITLFATFR